jgi:thymidylate kinase
MLLEGHWSPATTRARLADLMRGEDWTPLLAQRELLQRRLVQRDRLGTFGRRIRGRVLRKLNRWLHPGARRGPSLALLAPDGAGKSTLAALLRDTVPLPLRTLYMGLYPSGEAPSRIPGVGLVRRLLRQRGRWWVARWHQGRGRFVVFDRYGFDALLESPRRGAWHRRLRRALLARSCPPPDLVVLLDAPGEVLFARKGEHDPAALERQRRSYRRLLARLPRAALVDATRPVESVRREVTTLLWNAYRAGGATP